MLVDIINHPHWVDIRNIVVDNQTAAVLAAHKNQKYFQLFTIKYLRICQLYGTTGPQI